MSVRLLRCLLRFQATRALATPRFLSATRVSRNDGSSVSPRLFVGNLPNRATVSEVQDIFWAFGGIADLKMGFREGDASANKGFAHVEFAELKDAIAAYESHQRKPLWLKNRALVLRYAEESRKTRKTPDPPPSHALYFRDFEGGMKALQDVLKKYAQHVVCVNSRQPKEPGSPQTTGRIYFRSEAIATEALKELNGKVMENGVEIKLEFARLKARPSQAA